MVISITTRTHHCRFQYVTLNTRHLVRVLDCSIRFCVTVSFNTIIIYSITAVLEGRIFILAHVRSFETKRESCTVRYKFCSICVKLFGEHEKKKKITRTKSKHVGNFLINAEGQGYSIKDSYAFSYMKQVFAV